jgi:hypothetical protein
MGLDPGRKFGLNGAEVAHLRDAAALFEQLERLVWE